jgi:hypothetical protein
MFFTNAKSDIEGYPRGVRITQSALDSLISERGESVSYEDCWAEALQFPAVYETDLREWLKYRGFGLIRIDGRKRPNEVLKRKSNHVIVRLQP